MFISDVILIISPLKTDSLSTAVSREQGNQGKKSTSDPVTRECKPDRYGHTDPFILTSNLTAVQWPGTVGTCHHKEMQRNLFKEQ